MSEKVWFLSKEITKFGNPQKLMNECYARFWDIEAAHFKEYSGWLDKGYEGCMSADFVKALMQSKLVILKRDSKGGILGFVSESK